MEDTATCVFYAYLFRIFRLRYQPFQRDYNTTLAPYSLLIWMELQAIKGCDVQKSCSLDLDERQLDVFLNKR